MILIYCKQSNKICLSLRLIWYCCLNYYKLNLMLKLVQYNKYHIVHNNKCNKNFSIKILDRNVERTCPSKSYTKE